MTEEMTPAEHARSIDDARQRLISFVEQCPEAQWNSTPVDGDPRAVGVIADHVAHAYEYLAGWISDIVAGEPVDVTAEVVDDLNAGHAGEAGELTPAEVVLHLNASGDTLIGLISGLEPAQLEFEGGQVRRFAQIAARHADSHRTEIEAALGDA
jgi:hypothetical protein